MIHVLLLLLQSQRIGHPAFGIIIPAIIFIVSFLVAYGLYRRFSRTVPKDDSRDWPPFQSPDKKTDCVLLHRVSNMVSCAYVKCWVWPESNSWHFFKKPYIKVIQLSSPRTFPDQYQREGANYLWSNSQNWGWYNAGTFWTLLFAGRRYVREFFCFLIQRGP